ncbi:Uma2 family endonuclease [Spirosoma areae]
MIAEVHNDRYGVPKYAGQTMSKADFLRWESDDNYVYEFNDGVLEPTTGMRQDENYLLTNLENLFVKTSAFQNGWRLRPEMDSWVTNRQLRRPDVSFFDNEQLRQMNADVKVVPRFVVEFASESDSEHKGIVKLHEYFDAGVQVVWWVYPLYKEVYVYTSPKTVTICTDDDMLSAAPALPELQMTVEELFQR